MREREDDRGNDMMVVCFAYYYYFCLRHFLSCGNRKTGFSLGFTTKSTQNKKNITIPNFSFLCVGMLFLSHLIFSSFIFSFVGPPDPSNIQLVSLLAGHHRPSVLLGAAPPLSCCLVSFHTGRIRLLPKTVAPHISTCGGATCTHYKQP